MIFAASKRKLVTWHSGVFEDLHETGSFSPFAITDTSIETTVIREISCFLEVLGQRLYLSKIVK